LQVSDMPINRFSLQSTGAATTRQQAVERLTMAEEEDGEDRRQPMDWPQTFHEPRPLASRLAQRLTSPRQSLLSSELCLATR